MADTLAREGIGYNFANLMVAQTYGLGDNDWIEPARITSMRCDGFIEYVFEYNGLKLQGEPNVWNIAIMRGYKKHSGITMNPITQADSIFFC